VVRIVVGLVLIALAAGNVIGVVVAGVVAIPSPLITIPTITLTTIPIAIGLAINLERAIGVLTNSAVTQTLVGQALQTVTVMLSEVSYVKIFKKMA